MQVNFGSLLLSGWLTQQISGCITSAETVLINMQSTSEILSVLKQNELATEKKQLVASIAPQCVASLAAFHNITPLSMRRKLKTFVQSFGFEMLIDTSVAREISLVESAREFESRWRASHDHQQPISTPLPVLSSACPGWICYVEKTHHPIIPYLSATPIAATNPWLSHQTISRSITQCTRK